MRATKGGNASSKRDVQDAVREIPIEKEKGSFSDVLADLEQVLKEAKGGKLELPSLRAAAFESAERHGLNENSTYGRLVSNSARMELDAENSERAKKLHDDWMQFEASNGRRRGGNWGNKSVFPDVLDDLELILSEAKEGKRELPSLRQAAFEVAKLRGLSGNSTYGRLVLTAHRTEMGKEVAERAKSLRDEWIAEELKHGTYKGGKRSPIAKREKTLEDTSKFEASLWVKQRDWARNDLLRMFSSDSGGITWFSLILNKEEKERVIRWLDANTTADERAQFHPRIAHIANNEYGMSWTGRNPRKAPAKKASGHISYEGYDADEQEE